MRLKSFCAEPAAIAGYAPLWTADGRPFGLRLVRPIPQGFAARLTGVATKEEADALRGTELFADRDRLPSLPDDEYYHADLIGLAVVDTGGAALGVVRAVLNHGAGDFLEVHTPGGAAGAAAAVHPGGGADGGPDRRPHRRRPAGRDRRAGAVTARAPGPATAMAERLTSWSRPEPLAGTEATAVGFAPEQPGANRMIKLILILLVVAAVAGLLGFSTLSGAALTGAKLLIGVVLVLFLLVLFGLIAIA